MKKLISIIFIMILTVGILSGCGNREAEDKDHNVETEEKETIKIGLNYEINGLASTYGKSSVDGIVMAFDEINADGGINGKYIEVIVEDNKSEPAQAKAITEKLIIEDGVVAILGPATTGCFNAQISIAEKNGVPVITGSATGDDVTLDGEEVKDYAYRICYNDSAQGATLANFAKESLVAESAVIITDNSSEYSKDLAKNFQETFVESGGTIDKTISYVAKDEDFESILSIIKDGEYDVIFLTGYDEEVGRIIRQARILGIDVPILGGDSFDSDKLIELAGTKYLKDVYFSTHYSTLDEEPLVKEFIDGYRAAKNAEPNSFNALGYDLGMFIADAIKRSEAIDSEKIKEAIEETMSFNGVTGIFGIDESHNAEKPIVIIGFRDGIKYLNTKIDVEIENEEDLDEEDVEYLNVYGETGAQNDADMEDTVIDHEY